MASISVVIPTYNRAETLSLALDSLRQQTYGNFDVVVVDDGSTDGTTSLPNWQEQRILYRQLPHSGRPAVARNVGWRLAQGEYVAFLDSDDQWLPQKLEKQVAVLDRNPQAGLVCTNAYRLTEASKLPNQLYLPADVTVLPSPLLSLLDANFVITSTALVRRSMLERIGGFSENDTLIALEDYDLWLRMAVVSDVVYLPEPLAIYRDLPNASLRGSRRRVEHWQGMAMVFDNLSDNLSLLNGEARTVTTKLLRRQRECQINYVWSLLKDRLWLKASKTIATWLLTDPILVLRLGWRWLRK